jgi:aminopeptidase 2
MEWWSDIWLNEGFATYVGWMAVDHFYPDWETWTQFVIGGFTEGLSLDALQNSHPIHVNVKNASEVMVFGIKMIRLIKYLMPFLIQKELL